MTTFHTKTVEREPGCIISAGCTYPASPSQSVVLANYPLKRRLRRWLGSLLESLGVENRGAKSKVPGGTGATPAVTEGRGRWSA